MYINLVRFSKNLQNFLKRRFFGRVPPENPILCNRSPPLAQNPAIETPPQRGRNAITFSAWTLERARTVSYASLMLAYKAMMRIEK